MNGLTGEEKEKEGKREKKNVEGVVRWIALMGRERGRKRIRIREEGEERGGGAR